MSRGDWSHPRLRRVDDVLGGYVERGEIPGIVALLSRHGEEHCVALGRTQKDGAVPVQRDSIFRIASMTKPVVAAAAMLLIEECVLRLDDPVDHWLPELANRRVLTRIDAPLDDTVPATRAITLRDLLTFRCGWGTVLSDGPTPPIIQALIDRQLGHGPPNVLVPAPDEFMRRLGELPLMAQPGERWLYNIGSDILGVLIARAAGKPLDIVLRERLFEPLGMRDTAFFVPPEKTSRFVTAYFPEPKLGRLFIRDSAEGGHWNQPPAFPRGAGGLVSTADDFMAFGRMMLLKGMHGRDRVLSRTSVETMTTDQLTPEQKRFGGLIPGFFDDHGWGFGVSVTTSRTALYETVGRFGWDGGLGTSWASDPAEDLVGVLLTQREWTSPMPPAVSQDFWTATYQAFDD